MGERTLLVADEFARRHFLDTATVDRICELGEVTQLPAAAAPEEFTAALTGASALLLAGWDCDPPFLDDALLDTAPELTFIGCGQGNRWRSLDVLSALDRGVVCCDPSGVMGHVVAEFALGLLLSCLRDIPGKHRLVADGGWWSGWESDDELFPHLLRGSRVGIVGMGEIGRGMVELLRPFRCEVSAWSSYLDASTAAELGVVLRDVVDLCATSDVLVVATQPRRDTRDLVDARAVAALRTGAVVVLVGRAATVDVDALYRRVLADELRLGIDVYEREPLPAAHVLRGHRNVVHTPHVGSRTIAANRAIVTEMVADLERVRAGRPPRWATTVDRVAAVVGGKGAVRRG